MIVIYDILTIQILFRIFHYTLLFFTNTHFSNQKDLIFFENILVRIHICTNTHMYKYTYRIVISVFYINIQNARIFANITQLMMFCIEQLGIG